MNTFSDAATAVGRRLVREAIWHEDRCTWIGARAGADRGDEHEATLDPWLYEGTSGVALFLAELHDAHGDSEARDTALGAMRHALRAAPRAGGGPGLYVGTSGVALAASRVARLLDEAPLLEAARSLLSQVGAANGLSDGGDLLSGAAGTIVALLVLSHELDEPALIAPAASWGSALIAAGRVGPGLSWHSDARISRRPLTGLSHGVAGVGLALLQLGAATGEAHFSEAALKAFEYERTLFDRHEGNWPDLRAARRSSNPAPGFMSAWCHGGPGIALSRLCGVELLGDERCLEDAQIGLAVARASLERDVGSHFSLCHGTSGNAEILAEGAAALGGDGALAASAAMRRGVEQYGEDATWPCGTGGRASPGLMLGQAGIGRCLLRLAGASLPSILRVDGVAMRSEIGDDRLDGRPQ